MKGILLNFFIDLRKPSDKFESRKDRDGVFPLGMVAVLVVDAFVQWNTGRQSKVGGMGP